MTQEHGRRTQHEKTQETEEEQSRKLGAEGLKNTEIDEDVDDILAEIDDVLEVNAEAFVKNYIQKGGQ